MCSLVTYSNYFDWNHVGDYIPLQEAAPQWCPLRYLCVYYCIIILLIVISHGIINEASIF